MRSFTRLLLITLILLCATAAWADTMAPRVFIAREGKGYLERVGTMLVLHVKGTPEEMGRQQGVLLKDDINAMVRTIQERAKEKLGVATDVGFALFDKVWKEQQACTPKRYSQEIEALAKGCGLPFQLMRSVNTIPEFFHCSGFAVFGGATTDGALYHGRILDYGVDMGYQDHAVVVIAEPKGFVPFVNVSFAGFVGSVTGMNLKGIGFGEMGGNGQGKWDGTPMAFLMRRGMEESKTLADARAIFTNSKRTCEYYYVLSDAKIPSALGVAATPEKIEFVGPNEAYGPVNVPIKDAVVISGGDRYTLLTQRIKDNWGKLDATACRELMRRPVSMTSNLHSVLMAPKTAELWVAYATTTGEPASEQPYTYLNVKELMAKEPGR